MSVHSSYRARSPKRQFRVLFNGAWFQLVKETRTNDSGDSLCHLAAGSVTIRLRAKVLAQSLALGEARLEMMGYTKNDTH